MNFKHGKEMFDRGRIGEAVSFLQNACDQDPSKAEHFHYLAMAQSRNPRWKKDAEENFLKALERDPTNAEIYSQLGTLYAAAGCTRRRATCSGKRSSGIPPTRRPRRVSPRRTAARRGSSACSTRSNSPAALTSRPRS